MYIQVEETPNPSTLKFIVGSDILQGRPVQAFASREEAAQHSPLVEAIFTVDNVSAVFLGQDFVSVTKDEAGDWSSLKPAALAVMLEHFTLNRPVLNAAADTPDKEQDKVFFDPKDKEAVAEIRKLLEEKVRPIVAQDGGDIVFRGYEDGIVYLFLQGACAGCPSASLTLKAGIENMLLYYVDGVREVRAVV